MCGTDAHAPPARASPVCIARCTVSPVARCTRHVRRCTTRRGCCFASCAGCRTVRRLHEQCTNRPHRNREMRRPAPHIRGVRVLAPRIRHVAGASSMVNGTGCLVAAACLDASGMLAARPHRTVAAAAMPSRLVAPATPYTAAAQQQPREARRGVQGRPRCVGVRDKDEVRHGFNAI